MKENVLPSNVVEFKAEHVAQTPSERALLVTDYTGPVGAKRIAAIARSKRAKIEAEARFDQDRQRFAQQGCVVGEIPESFTLIDFTEAKERKLKRTQAIF